MRRYLFHLSTASVLALALAVGCNWLADPYAIFGSPRIAGFNAAKPAIETHGRIFKMVGYLDQPIDALILGTSRAQNGLNPKHPAFGDLRAFNFAMAAQPYAETALIFKQVSDRNPLRTAVVGLDFFAANAYLPFTNDFTAENFARDRKWKLLLSFDTLKDSQKTLFQTGKPPVAPNAARLNKRKKFDKHAFLASEQGYMWGGTYLPAPFCRFALDAEPGSAQHEPPLEQLRALIALAHQRKIALALFISPSHARQWETLAALGLWDRWEEWKRRLVEINEQEAARAGRPAFPLWDFSGYNRVTSENLPDADDRNAEMFGYIESSHYKPNIGDWVLDRLFDTTDEQRPAPNDFGVRLSSANIAAHLADVRSARARYRQGHAPDIAEIAALERETKAKSRCAGQNQR